MSRIEVFEPALCCGTGVCGPDVPQDLVTFGADVDRVREQGASVSRFNLAGEPEVFVDNPVVLDFLRVSGSEGLPLVLVDGAVAMAGRYPGRGELERWAHTDAAPAAARTVLPMADSGGCCGGGCDGSC